MLYPILLALALAAADQGVKLLISRFAPDAELTLIPGALVFQPVHNTNLNWLSSMAGITPPVWLMVALQVLMLAAVVLIYRYLAYRSSSRGGLLALFFSFAAAGICCSFIDVVFWGGSLDFLGLFDWFVFDTKDLFLNASWIIIAIRELTRKQPSPDKAGEKGGIMQWFRLGCPM